MPSQPLAPVQGRTRRGSASKPPPVIIPALPPKDAKYSAARVPFSPIQPESAARARYGPAPRAESPVGTAGMETLQLSPKVRGPEYVTMTTVGYEPAYGGYGGAYPPGERPSRRPLPTPPPPVFPAAALPRPVSPGYTSTTSASSPSPRLQQTHPRPAPPAGHLIGPFKLLRELHGGMFGGSFVAHDRGSSGRVVCARVFAKPSLAGDARLYQGVRVEATVYKIIAAASAPDRAHLMGLHGILQDEERVLFIMVRAISLSSRLSHRR